MNNREIVDSIFGILKFEFAGRLETVEHDGVYVSLKGGNAVIGGSTPTEISRAAFLLAKAVNEGKSETEICQKAKIKSCGVMLDLSRNAVMRVEAVKELILRMAALGLNLLMLYTEDTYEIKEKPYFGYMRGRYSADELREIVDFADSFGVEVVPCIQTLAHLAHYLKWPEADAVRDAGDCMLVDAPETYELIESMIKTCRGIFRTNRIHVGMDEAHFMGKGVYLKKFGEANRLEMFTRHVAMVRDICRKYDFKPMIWGDMFFRISSAIVEYVDLDVNIPESIASRCDGVDIVYWNFCHTDVHTHDVMIKKHEAFEGETVFAGGIWTWKGVLPRIDYTRKNSAAVLKAALQNNLQTVFAPMWNDLGFANLLLGVPLMAVYSEYMYRGEDAADEDIISAGELASGVSRETTAAMDVASFEHDGQGAEFWEGHEFSWKPTCRADDFFFGDLFINLTLRVEHHYDTLIKLYEDAEKTLSGENTVDARISALFLSVAKDKIGLYRDLRKAYVNDDREELSRQSEVLKNLVLKHKTFNAEFEKMWMSTYKPFGFELKHIVLGGLLARCEYALRKLEGYLKGEINRIEELIEQPLEVPLTMGILSCASVSSKWE